MYSSRIGYDRIINQCTGHGVQNTWSTKMKAKNVTMSKKSEVWPHFPQTDNSAAITTIHFTIRLCLFKFILKVRFEQ